MCVKLLGQAIKSHPNMVALGPGFDSEQTSWEPLSGSKTGGEQCASDLGSGPVRGTPSWGPSQLQRFCCRF